MSIVVGRSLRTTKRARPQPTNEEPEPKPTTEIENNNSNQKLGGPIGLHILPRRLVNDIFEFFLALSLSQFRP